jgi:pyrroline-5-carboxylate reductase
MRGTAKMLEKLDPDALVKMVASPQGTTAEGLKVMEKERLKDVLEKVVAAAARRSRELSRSQLSNSQ